MAETGDCAFAVLPLRGLHVNRCKAPIDWLRRSRAVCNRRQTRPALPMQEGGPVAFCDLSNVDSYKSPVVFSDAGCAQLFRPALFSWIFRSPTAPVTTPGQRIVAADRRNVGLPVSVRIA